MNRHPFPGAERPMPLIDAIGRRWWAFPLALLISLAVIATVAAASARAGEPLGGRLVPAAAMDLGGLFLPAGTTEGPEGGDVPGEPMVRVAPILGTEITVQVSGLIARYSVTHHFRNPTDRWTEAIYTYPLPTDSAVDRLTMTVGGRVSDGVIKERAEARRLYTAAKTSGRRASLVEQQRPNIFTTAVANLGPGETATVAIQFQDRLVFRDGQFSLRLPLVVGPRYIPGRDYPVNFAGGGGWARDTDVVPDASKISPPLRRADEGRGNPVTLTVDISAGFDIGAITSPSHDIQIDHGEAEPGHARVTLAGDGVPADGDFVLRWSPDAASAAPQAGFFWEKTGDETYGLLMVMPPVSGGAGVPLPQGPARDVTFVLDTSGSMAGTSLTQAKTALVMALDRLTPVDRFRLIRFASGYSDLTPRPVTAETKTLAMAKEYVRGLQAEGGTEIVNAVTAALAGLSGDDPDPRPDDGRRLKQVVLITDGAVGDEDRLLSLINGRIGDARLFTVGIGSAPNGFLMTRAARAGRGTYSYIRSADEVSERMAELFLKLERPALTDVALKWSNGDNGGLGADHGLGAAGAEVWPRRLPDLYAGEPMVALMKLNGAGPQVTVSGRLGGRFWEQTVTITGGAAAPGVAALWGREKIRHLTADMRDAAVQGGPDAEARRDALRGKIVETALKFSLISKYTSLVAVDREPGRPAGTELSEAQVPVNLPAGWQRDHVEGAPADPKPAPGPQKTLAPSPDSLSPDARAANAVAPVADPDSAMGRPEAPGQGAALAFDRTDPAVRLHLAAAVAGTPLLAMPQTATPAEAYMALGVLFVVAAFAMLLLGWRGPRPPRPGGDGAAPPKPGGDD